MNNIIIVKLDSTYAAVYSGIWQWNYGQILRIQGGNLPKVVEVHFSLQDKGGDSTTRIGTTVDGATDVPIPDSFLENGGCAQDYKIYAFIYLEDGTAGNTEYKIEMSVKSRPKPEVPGTPEEPELFRETVKAVNDAADRAEMAAHNAKASATEAGKYAASASESAVAAEKTKEDALRKVGEKKQEAIEAIREQEETSVGKVTTHTDNEIQRIQNQTATSKGELEQTIANAGASKKELDNSIETAGTSKTALDKSTELAGTAKTELDTSTQKAGEAKTALDGSARTAGEMQETLSATVKQAGALDTSLSEKIETGTQLKTDLVASGEKAVQDIQNAGSEQLGKMQAVAEEFTADREQINVNKEDISILKEEMSKNYLDDAKTKRSLDALWKLNQGISYQFEADAEKAYQKDIPSGAKLASVKKIGGRTIVWNQLVLDGNFQLVRKWSTQRVNPIADNGELTCTVTVAGAGSNSFACDNNTKTIVGHKYYITTNWYIASTNASSGFVCGLRGALPASPIPGNPDVWNKYSTIGTVTNSSSIFIATLGGYTKVGDIFKIKNVMVTDLTKMFGAGNEPSTPEEFEALFSEDYYPYNEGELMSIPVNEVVEHGRNLVNILMSESGGIDTYGNPVPGNTLWRTNEYIEVNSNTKYILSAKFASIYRIYEYDVDKNYISRIEFTSSTESDIVRKITTSNKTRYIKWSLYDANVSKEYVESLNIQIEKALTATAYSPYHKNTYPIPQAILELDGYGDGVSSDVYNYVDWENKEYHKRVGRVDLGELTYDKLEPYIFRTAMPIDGIKSINDTAHKIVAVSNIYFPVSHNTGYEKPNIDLYMYQGIARYTFKNKIILKNNSYDDVDIFKQAMQGVMLYYELAEEEIIDISDIIDNIFQEPIEVEAGGTLTFHNSNGDGYRLPIPNEEEYIVSLADIGGGASE